MRSLVAPGCDARCRSAVLHSRIILRRSRRFHAIGEEPSEPLVEPVLEASREAAEVEQESDHGSRLFLPITPIPCRSVCADGAVHQIGTATSWIVPSFPGF